MVPVGQHTCIQLQPASDKKPMKDRTVTKEVAIAGLLVLAWVALSCLLIGLAIVFTDLL